MCPSNATPGPGPVIAAAEKPPIYDRPGFCPICEAPSGFTAKYDWYRDHLFCTKCRSVPRERALALVLQRRFPGWRSLKIHESSPEGRGVSAKLRRECTGYQATQFFPKETPGAMIRGFRNENLESQTFGDALFDIVVTLDVLEHVNYPEKCLAEVARTLKPGGAFIFSVPTFKGKVVSERRALVGEDGVAEHLFPAEYHGNPVSDKGALVTFHYGYDLAEMIYRWSGLDVECHRFHDHLHGIIGDFTEVYVAVKRGTSELPP